MPYDNWNPFYVKNRWLSFSCLAKAWQTIQKTVSSTLPVDMFVAKIVCSRETVVTGVLISFKVTAVLQSPWISQLNVQLGLCIVGWRENCCNWLLISYNMTVFRLSLDFVTVFVCLLWVSSILAQPSCIKLNPVMKLICWFGSYSLSQCACIIRQCTNNCKVCLSYSIGFG